MLFFVNTGSRGVDIVAVKLTSLNNILFDDSIRCVSYHLKRYIYPMVSERYTIMLFDTLSIYTTREEMYIYIYMNEYTDPYIDR